MWHCTVEACGLKPSVVDLSACGRIERYYSYPDPWKDLGSRSPYGFLKKYRVPNWGFYFIDSPRILRKASLSWDTEQKNSKQDGGMLEVPL